MLDKAIQFIAQCKRFTRQASGVGLSGGDLSKFPVPTVLKKGDWAKVMTVAAAVAALMALAGAAKPVQADIVIRDNALFDRLVPQAVGSTLNIGASGAMIMYDLGVHDQDLYITAFTVFATLQFNSGPKWDDFDFRHGLIPASNLNSIRVQDWAQQGLGYGLIQNQVTFLTPSNSDYNNQLTAGFGGPVYRLDFEFNSPLLKPAGTHLFGTLGFLGQNGTTNNAGIVFTDFGTYGDYLHRSGTTPPNLVTNWNNYQYSTAAATYRGFIAVPEPSALTIFSLSMALACVRRNRIRLIEHRVAATAATSNKLGRRLAIGTLAVVAAFANVGEAFGDLVTFRDTTSSASTSIGGAPSHADVIFQSVGMPILSADPLARDILELDFIFGKSTNGVANIGNLANYNFEISQLNAATLSTYDIVQHYNFIDNNQLYSSHVTDRLQVSAPAGIENPYNTSGQYHLHRGTFAVDFYLPADTVGAYSAIGLPQNGEGSVLLLQFSNGSNFQDWIDLSNDPRFAVLNTDFPAPLAEYAFAARGSYTVPEPSAFCLLGLASIIPLCLRRCR